MGDATKPAVQWLLIVSTKSRALFDYLSRSFRDVPTVEVILDRRDGERRRSSARASADRRRADRRVDRKNQRERYPLLGYLLVRRNGAASGHASTRTGNSDPALRLPAGAEDLGTLPWPNVRTDAARDDDAAGG